MKAIFNNQVIAESDDTIKLEGNYYFPADSVSEAAVEIKGMVAFYDNTVEIVK